MLMSNPFVGSLQSRSLFFHNDDGRQLVGMRGSLTMNRIVRLRLAGRGPGPRLWFFGTRGEVLLSRLCVWSVSAPGY